jgi:TolA-binding protein
MIRDRSSPFYIAGTEVRVVIPFHGDAGLFEVQPTMFTSNPPFGEIRSHELHLVYLLTDANFDVDAATNRTIGQVKQYLQSLQGSAEQLKSEIQQLVNAMIAKRKQERRTHSQIVASLKIPIKQAPLSPPPAAVLTAPAKKQEEEWDVFISHASEDEETIATPLAEARRLLHV